MGGYSADPRVRLGLIALLALRRSKAEQARRATADAGKATAEADTGDGKKPARPRKRGWFR